MHLQDYMTSEEQGIPEAQSTPDDTLLRIVGAIKGLPEAVRAQAESTKMVLQHIQETQDRNNSNYGEGNRNSNKENPIANLSHQGLSEFRKATPPSFYGDYDPTLAKRWVMQLEKIFTVMGYIDA